MDAARRKEIVEKLHRAFGAKDASPSSESDLHVLFPALELPPPWKPSPTRALAIFPANWPTDPRPAFYVDTAVVGDGGQPPRNPTDAYLLDETWRTFSWNAAWAGDDPVRAIQLWINRFVTETT